MLNIAIIVVGRSLWLELSIGGVENSSLVNFGSVKRVSLVYFSQHKVDFSLLSASIHGTEGW